MTIQWIICNITMHVKVLFENAGLPNNEINDVCNLKALLSSPEITIRQWPLDSYQCFHLLMSAYLKYLLNPCYKTNSPTWLDSVCEKIVL